MMVSEKTTFESLKGRIEQYEAITTKWSTENVLGLPSQTSMEGPTPMDVDYIGGYQKGKKGKGKDGKSKHSKGKSKKGQGYNDFRVKGKSKDEKGKSKGKGKSKERCWNCGKTGHRSRDCWAPRNINQVEGDWTYAPATPSSWGTTGGGTVSGGAQSSASSSAGSASIRMIRLVTPPDMNETRMFDLTAGEDEFLAGMIQEVEDESYAVLMVEREDDESFFDAHEPVVEEIGKATVVLMDLQGENFETEDETYQVNMVMDEEMDHGWSKVLMTVDSGADISVLPEEFAGVGEEAHEGGRQIIMKDAQGNVIQQSGMRKVNFAMMGKDGIPVNFVEKFIVGKVKHPILCAGRLLRSGWEMRRSGDGLNLWHNQRVEIPLEMKQNSLQVVAEICSVETENNEHEEEWNTVEVCVLEGFLGASFKELEKTPGWHVLLNGLAAYSDPVLDPSGTFDWKARMTFMKAKDGEWMQAENVSDYTQLGNMAFRRFGPAEDPQRTITVVAPAKMKGYFEVDSEVLVAQFFSASRLFPQRLCPFFGGGLGTRAAQAVFSEASFLTCKRCFYGGQHRASCKAMGRAGSRRERATPLAVSGDTMVVSTASYSTRASRWQ